MSKMNNGFIDNPLDNVDEDLLGIKKYTDGLSEFIKCCNTPMTIAIQGDWGSGKTSFMNIIRKKMVENAEIIWFNTWQFSQFNMQGNIAMVFINYVMNAMNKYINDNFQIKSSIQENAVKVGRSLFKLTTFACDIAFDSGVGKRMYDEVFDNDSIQAIEQLKQEFQKDIDIVCKERGKDRIVFFVDDLDRLQPLRAVELLEVLKLFLDCNHCVFVLAIDYEVVSQGIMQKYNGSLDEAKGRKFFEKIIQVPFKMPIAQYDIRGYVEKTFGELGINIEKYKDNYIEIIQNSVGCNPRTMKRTFNAYLLLTKIGFREEDMTDSEQFFLFACLCMQLAYEDLYSYFVLHMPEDEIDSDTVVIDEEFFDGIIQEEFQDEIYEEIMDIIKNNVWYEDEQALRFLKSFSNMFNCNDKKKMIEELRGVLKMAPIMSTSGSCLVKKEKKEYVYEDDFKEISLKDLVDNLKEKSAKKCIIQSFRIHGKQTNLEKEVTLSSLYKELIEYAYECKPKEFIEFRKEAMGYNNKFRKFFKPEETSAPRSKVIVTGNKYGISTNYSNDMKLIMIKELFERLSVSFEGIFITIKYANIAK